MTLRRMLWDTRGAGSLWLHPWRSLRGRLFLLGVRSEHRALARSLVREGAPS